MLGMHPQSKSRGGILSVVDVYRDRGLFSKWPIVYLGTVCDGAPVAKFRIAVAAVFKFLRIVLTGRLALLHAHTASRASFWRKSIFILIALAARKPVVLHLHGAEFNTFYHRECGPLRKRFVRFVLEHVRVVIVLSAHWDERIGAIAPRSRRAIVSNPFPAGVDDGGSAPRREDALLFLGRFGVRKGIFDLLQALAIVRTRFPNVRLLCGGDGDVAGVRTRARELGIEQSVEILGWVSGAAKQQVLAEATVYVLPSHAEGLPMGVLEAMAAGAPVVATCVGGIPDAVEDEVDGLLVEPGDVDALADRIVRLLGDASLRATFAAKARRKVVERFSPEKVLVQLETLYWDLGATPRNTRGHDERLRQTTGAGAGIR
jgi:glycosyltransferase involved in cell wall biosynthesis